MSLTKLYQAGILNSAWTITTNVTEHMYFCRFSVFFRKSGEWGAFHSFESSIVIQFLLYITKNESAKLWISLLGTIQFDMFSTTEYWMIIEDQASSLSYDLAPPPFPPPLLSVSSTGDTEEDWEKRHYLSTEGGGGEAKSYDGEKAWSSINHSILSVFAPYGESNWRL